MAQGTYTPLQLNILAGFLEQRGLSLNNDSVVYQGNWSPAGYFQGKLTSETVLADLVVALTFAHDNVLPTTFIALSQIGSGTIPALGNSKPNTFIPSYPGPSDPYPPNDYPNTANQGWLGGWTRTSPASYIKVTGLTSDYWKYGFIACIARQAYYEFFSEQSTQYYAFCKSWVAHHGWMLTQNQTVSSFVGAQTFNLGTYSNINDLTSGDISGVTPSFKLWGRDLINLGKVFTLKNIWRSGAPSVLLVTLNNSGALTDALKLLLLLTMTPDEINNILAGTLANRVQERKIYDAFKNIQGQDLANTLLTMNCATQGLRSLADLLDPKYMFPQSYMTLTVPTYSANTTSYKIYDLIYQNDGVNIGTTRYGDYLTGVLPPDIAYAQGAWSFSMQQISNIMGIDPEKFAQVVFNMEVTNQGLPALVNTQALPANQTLVNNAIGSTAYGSGAGKTYRMCDFFGAASGVPYVFSYQQIFDLLKSMATPALFTVYAEIKALCQAPIINEPALLNKIAIANGIIAGIQTANHEGAKKLNQLWDGLGSQLVSEHRAIVMSIPDAEVYITELNRNDLVAFVSGISQYAIDTAYGGSNQVLCAFAGNLLTNAHLSSTPNLTSITQQSIIAACREARNNVLLESLGVIPQNLIPDFLVQPGGQTSGSINDPPPQVGSTQATATAEIVDNNLVVTLTSGGSGYDPCQPPTIAVWALPTARVGVSFTCEIDTVTGSIVKINTLDADQIVGYPAEIQPRIYISPPPPPQRPGGALVTGSQAGSPYVDYVPDNLITSNDQSLSAQQAIQSVNR